MTRRPVAVSRPRALLEVGGCDLTELEEVWRGRIARMDELFHTEEITDSSTEGT